MKQLQKYITFLWILFHLLHPLSALRFKNKSKNKVDFLDINQSSIEFQHNLSLFRNEHFNSTNETHHKLQQNLDGFYIDIFLYSDDLPNFEVDVCMAVDVYEGPLGGVLRYPGSDYQSVITSSYGVQYKRFCLNQLYSISLCVRTPSNCNDLTAFIDFQGASSYNQVITVPLYIAIEESSGCYVGSYLTVINGDLIWENFNTNNYYCSYCTNPNFFSEPHFGWCGSYNNEWSQHNIV